MSGKFTIYMKCTMVDSDQELSEYFKTFGEKIEESLSHAPFVIESIGFNTDFLEDHEELKKDITTLWKEAFNPETANNFVI
jgi:hypothetical protein